MSSPARRKPLREGGEGALARHRLSHVVAPLAALPTFVSRAMFGCVGCYLKGRLVLVLADRRDPWAGLLIPTERVRHPSLLAELDGLRVHPVLGKWLYLPHADDAFGVTAAEIVTRILAGDERFGVEPGSPRLPRMSSRSARKRPRTRPRGGSGGSR